MEILVIVAGLILLVIAVLFPRRRELKHDLSLIFDGESPMKVHWYGTIVLLFTGIALLLIIFLAALAGIILLFL